MRRQHEDTRFSTAGLARISRNRVFNTTELASRNRSVNGLVRRQSSTISNRRTLLPITVFVATQLNSSIFSAYFERGRHHDVL